MTNFLTATNSTDNAGTALAPDADSHATQVHGCHGFNWIVYP